MSNTLPYEELEILAKKMEDGTITEDEKFALLQAIDTGLDEVLEMMEESENISENKSELLNVQDY